MEVVEASIVLLPRFTTLVGRSSAGQTFDFTTLPLDVSKFSGAQFQFWRGPGAGSLGVYLEESLDAATWALGPFSPSEIAVPANETVFFSYNFLLRWFRLRVRLTGSAWPIITCWAEGLLRGGGSGAWPGAEGPPASDRGLVAAGAMESGGGGGKGAPAAGVFTESLDPDDPRLQAAMGLMNKPKNIVDEEAFARLIAQATKK